MTGDFGTTLAVARPVASTPSSQLGATIVYSDTYNVQGESNWRPFVEQMRDAGVEVFEFIGEPENLANLQAAMETVGFFPELIILQTNFYDERYIGLAGDIAQNIYIRSAYTPYELADDNPATADYLELMERYNPGGKIAQLGHAGHLGVPALRPGGDGVWLRPHAGRASWSRRPPSPSGPAAGCTRSRTRPSNIPPDCGLMIARDAGRASSTTRSSRRRTRASSTATPTTS